MCCTDGRGRCGFCQNAQSPWEVRERLVHLLVARAAYCSCGHSNTGEKIQTGAKKAIAHFQIKKKKKTFLRFQSPQAAVLGGQPLTALLLVVELLGPDHCLPSFACSITERRVDFSIKQCNSCLILDNLTH